MNAASPAASRFRGSCHEFFAIVSADRIRLLARDNVPMSSMRLFELLPKHPIISVAGAMRLTGASKPTAPRAVEALVAAGILVETTGKRRDRSFAYRSYIDHLRTGTEL
jgi:hypothetical protein